MDIKNFTQFVSLLINTQSIHANACFDRLVICKMSYESMCACGGTSNQDKSNKHNECNRIYRESLGFVDVLKARLFQGSSDNVIKFYVDDIHLVKTLVR